MIKGEEILQSPKKSKTAGLPTFGEFEVEKHNDGNFISLIEVIRQHCENDPDYCGGPDVAVKKFKERFNVNLLFDHYTNTFEIFNSETS